ncbi:hypothetical protein XENOCAPTIV_018649 [Xenoophorus captivus]|uniref:Uncharacterized protein n=1 Tax=Xenoophorus captivus TaxID=1517983 RepID=A0ABV0RW59_9TELE
MSMRVRRTPAVQQPQTSSRDSVHIPNIDGIILPELKEISTEVVNMQLLIIDSTSDRLLFQQEQLSELTSREEEMSLMQRFGNLIVHVLAWVTCLASIVLSVVGVYFLSKVRRKLKKMW